MSASAETETPTSAASDFASDKSSLSEEFPAPLFCFCSASFAAILAFACDSVIPSVTAIPRASSFAFVSLERFDFLVNASLAAELPAFTAEIDVVIPVRPFFTIYSLPNKILPE